MSEHAFQQIGTIIRSHINRFLLFHLTKDSIVNMSCFGHILRVIAYNLQLVLYEKHLLGLQKQYFVRNTKLIILRFFYRFDHVFGIRFKLINC